MQLTRRDAISSLALAAAAAPAAEPDSATVRRHDQDVARLLARQITDPASRGYGCQPDDQGLYAAGAAAGLLQAYCAAFLCPQSAHYHDAALVERMKLAARFLDHAQNERGFIDLLVTNFSSPPDTGFVVHTVATAAVLAQRARERELLAMAEPFLRKAAAGLLVGGIHTPNHRWVVSQALAQVNEIFPNPDYVRRIDQWLAEGIDLDPDGQYTERSTSVYNTVSDRAFLVMGIKLKRPELFDPVRRNLEAMLYLLHPGYEVVTEISRRQDRNQRADMGGYWLPLRYLAMRDGNGRFATVAAHFDAQRASLAWLMEYPEMNGVLPAPAPLPEDFERLLPSIDAVRFRRGTVSATLLSGDSIFFTFRRGGAVVNAVRFASAFFGKGQFVPKRLEREDGSWVLRQQLAAPYYQPLAQKVPPAEWAALRARRKQTQICHLRQSATVTENAGGFRLRLTAEGTPGVPLAVEISLRPGGKLDGAAGGGVLSSGYATYTAEGDSVRFGPGLGEHRYTEVRGAEEKLPGLSVYLTGFTPFDHTLEF